MHSSEGVRRFPVGFGWDADPEGNFCILTSAVWEGSLDVENLLTNAICRAGFGRLCPEGVFFNFCSWLHEIMNCNRVLAYLPVYKSLPSARKIICPAKFSSLVLLYTTKFYKQPHFVCNEPLLSCCLPPERGLHTSPVEERHHMCLSCAQGLEGCSFGEHISSVEDTCFGGGWEATGCRYIPADGTLFDLFSTDM